MFVIFKIFIVLRALPRNFTPFPRTRMNDARTRPLVSILTPTYARHAFLPYLAHMISSQTTPLRRIEWIVVDDSASSFEHWFHTCALHRQLMRLTYVHLPHKMTIGCKRNLVKTLASGEYLVHMDDDDYYAPNYVETVLSMFYSTDTPSLIGATTIYLMFPDSLYLYQSGPFRQNHSCAGAMSYTKAFANANHFDNSATHREEPSFLQNHPMMQIKNAYNINMVFVHANNTVSKEHLRRKPTTLRWIDVIQHPTIMHFYLSLHATQLPMHNQLTPIKSPRANYGLVFYAYNVLLALQEMMVVLMKVLDTMVTEEEKDIAADRADQPPSINEQQQTTTQCRIPTKYLYTDSSHVTNSALSQNVFHQS